MKKLSRAAYLMTFIFPLIFNPVFAQGFQNFEQNASALGDAYAGMSASAEDASTGYFNPAGLVLFDTRQVTYSTVADFDDSDFSGNSIWQSYAAPFGTPSFLYQQTGSASGNKTQYFPAFNEAIPFNKRFAVGLNVGIPYSIDTDYSNNSIVRYEATESHFYVVDIAPSMAYLFTPKWSLGIGADFDYAHADFDSIVGLPAPVFSGANPTLFDSQSENEGGDWGLGWHGGVLYQYSPVTRFGLAYHSQVNFDLTGESELTGPIVGINGLGLINNNLNMPMKTPNSADFSVYHALTQQWELLGSVVYTDWSNLNNIGINNAVYVINGLPVAVNSQIPLHLRNTWYTAVGTNYKINSQFTLRGGLGFAESPATQNTSIMIPTNNNVIVGTGIQYNLNQMWGFDLGYQHWFAIQNSVRNTNVNTVNALVSSNGQLKQNVNLVGFQITWNIGML